MLIRYRKVENLQKTTKYAILLVISIDGGIKMNDLSITACSFHTRKKNKKGIEGICSLNKPKLYKDKEKKEEKEFPNFMEVFMDFWGRHGEYNNYIEEQKLFSFDKSVKIAGEEANYMYFMGKINSGAYGIESEITDIETNEVVYKKKDKDADIKPFYFFLAIPKKNDKYEVEKGIIIFQNIGVYGIKTITMNYLKEYLAEYFNISIYSGNICPEVFVERLLKDSKINKLTVVKNNISNDTSDNIGIGYGKQEVSYSKLIMKDSMKEKLINFIKSQNRIFELEDSKYDQVKVNVEDAAGRVRTINLNNINNLSIIESLPKEIRLPNGYPDQEKILEHFKKVTDGYMEKMIFKITN